MERVTLAKVGVLVHVYHLEAVGWEKIVWGDPRASRMGTLPKLIQLLLQQDHDDPIEAILMYTGPSRKDGLNESEYAQRFLLDHFEQLKEFPQLRLLIEGLSEAQWQDLRAQVGNIVNGPQLINSADEINNAARYFREHGMAKVYQLAAASHAPRCIQLQAMARATGNIPQRQLWYAVAADTTYADTTPSDVVVVEPPHRGDDPMLGIHPSITDVLKQYYKLPYDQRAMFINGVERLLASISGTW